MRQQDKEYTRESMHKREGVNCYERRNASPVKYSAVRGFFRSNVGRPWDKVFSDFCHKYDIRTATGRYARDMIDWMVEVNPDLDDKGNVLVRYRYSYRDNFYVHPRTGILMKVKVERWKRPRKPLDEQIIEIEGRSFYKFDDIWYECLWKALPEKDGADTLENRMLGHWSYYRVRDIFEQKDKDIWGVRSFRMYHEFERHYVTKYGKPVYCYNKLQVGKKDIKQINAYIAKYSK